jgi:hypothetical protein
MDMNESLFDYLKPTNEQMLAMNGLRESYAELLSMIEQAVPDGAYRMLAVRALEESGMWANKGITRDNDGSPRANP